jgi:hypothetical protein
MAAQPYALIATFDTAPDVYHAAEQVRDAGYRHWDAITPFPVHGLDRCDGAEALDCAANFAHGRH